MKTLLDTVKELHDVFYFHEFENGVNWLSEFASTEFRKKHPMLVKAIEDVIEEAQNDPEWHNE